MFTEPVINSAGQVAYYGLLATEQSGAWKTIGGQNIPVVLTDTEGPLGPQAGPGVRFTGLDHIELNDRGDVAAHVGLIGGNELADAVLLNVDGVNHLVARARTSGALGPNLGDNGIFPFISSNVILSNTREVLFSADVEFSSYRGGVWTADLAGPNPRIMRFDDGAYGPRMGPGVVYTEMTYPYINTHGKIVFGASISTGFPNNGGLWTLEDSDLRLIAIEGNTAELGPQIPGLSFADQFLSYDINATGEVAFRQLLNSGQFGLWRHSTSGNMVLALSGTDGPLGPQLGPDTWFSNFGSVALNDLGGMAFEASVNPANNPGDRRFGIFKRDEGGIQPVALGQTEGALGPHLGPGVVFSRVGVPLLNNADQLIFEAGLTGAGIDNTKNEGIWAFVDDELFPVVVKGDAIDVDPGVATDLRTITDIHFFGAHSPPSEGRNSYINDAGQIAFGVDFADGTSVILVATIPEPGAMYLIAVAAGMAILANGARKHRQARRGG